jgi:hypothetical protein
LDIAAVDLVLDTAALFLRVATFAPDVLALPFGAAALERAGLDRGVTALVLRVATFFFVLAAVPLAGAFLPFVDADFLRVAAVLAFVDVDLVLGFVALALRAVALDLVCAVLARVVVFLVFLVWAAPFRVVAFLDVRLAGPLLAAVFGVVVRFAVLVAVPLFVADFFAIKSCPPNNIVYSIPLDQRLSAVVESFNALGRGHDASFRNRLKKTAQTPQLFNLI